MASSADAALIDKYLRSKGSPLAGRGETFVAAGRATGIDPWFVVAIMGAETRFGTTGNAAAIHNPFGLGPGKSYPSWDDAIGAAFRSIQSYGTTSLTGVARRWAPVGAANDPTGLNGNWVRLVSQFYRETGHNPNNPITTDAQGTSIGKDIKQAPADAAKDAGNAIADNVLGPILDVAGNLVNRAFWIRVGFVVGGSAALIFAARILFRESAGFGGGRRSRSSGGAKSAAAKVAPVASSAAGAAAIAA